MRYALAVLVLAVIGLAPTVLVLKARVDALRLERDAARAQLVTCDARLGNIQEDTKDDATIDALTDGNLRAVPDRWLLR